MKRTKKVISLILILTLIISVFSIGNIFASAATGSGNPYSVAAKELDAKYAYDGELGAIYSPKSTVFKVWAPLATSVQLNRYATGSDKEKGAKDLGSCKMEKLMNKNQWTGVWSYTVSGDIKNTYYTYSITNPTHICYDEGEDVKYVTHETQDIYSKAVGVNGDRSMVVDLDGTDPAGWDQDSHVFTEHQSDAIVWEVQGHEKKLDFTRTLAQHMPSGPKGDGPL